MSRKTRLNYRPFPILTSVHCFIFSSDKIWLLSIFGWIFSNQEFFIAKRIKLVNWQWSTPTQYLSTFCYFYISTLFYIFSTTFGCWVYLGHILLSQFSNQTFYITQRNHVINLAMVNTYRVFIDPLLFLHQHIVLYFFRQGLAAEYIWGTFYYRNNITRSLLAHGLNKISLLAILYSKAGAA